VEVSFKLSVKKKMLFFCFCLTDSGSRIHLECSLGESDYHFAYWLKSPFL